MTAPNYTPAADALADWRDSLFNGSGPRLYAAGAGDLARFELGPGRVVLLGGLPGGGKTALAVQIVVDALRADATLRALVVNVEMSPAVLLDRQLARVSGVALDHIAKRTLDASHADRIDRGLATLEPVADRLAFLSAPYDLANLAAAADDFEAELLVVDYLQRIRPPGAHADKRSGVDALMDNLRQFADAGCAVLAVSAVARTKDSRGRSSYSGDGLSLASFRESSELEYGADSAFVLVPGNADDDPDAVTLRCLKHRHGEPADIALHFDKPLQRFRAADPQPPAAGRSANLAKLHSLWNATPPAGAGGGA